MTPQASIAPFTAGTRTCLSCGEPLPRYHRGETCRRCQEQPPETDELDREIAEAEAGFFSSLSSLPIEHILEELSCDELAACAPFNRSAAALVKSGERPLTPEEERFIREHVDGIKPKRRERDKERGETTMNGAIIDGIKLVPASLPGRQGNTNWAKVVEEFVRSGLDCARIDGGTHKKASSAYAMLRGSIGGRPCKPVVRKGHCYLIRTDK